MILLLYTMKRRPPDETKETTGKFVFPSVLRHPRLHHKISGKNTYYVSDSTELFEENAKHFLEHAVQGEVFSCSLGD